MLDDVDDLGCDKVRQQAVKCPVQTEKDACNTVYNNVKSQYYLAYGQVELLADEEGDDLRAVQAAAALEDQSDAKAEEDAAEDDDQDLFVGDCFHFLKDAEEDGESDHREHCFREEEASEPLEADDEERDVYDDRQDTDLHRQVLAQDHGDADDASVEDRERHEEFLQRESRDRRTYRDHDKRDYVVFDYPCCFSHVNSLTQPYDSSSSLRLLKKKYLLTATPAVRAHSVLTLRLNDVSRPVGMTPSRVLMKSTK